MTVEPHLSKSMDSLSRCLKDLAEEVLQTLKSIYGQPEFGVDWDEGNVRWTLDPDDPYEWFFNLEKRRVWLRDADDSLNVWEDWDRLRELKTWRAIVSLLDRFPHLRKRITAATAGSFRMISSELELPGFLQTQLLEPLIYERESFELDRAILDRECEKTIRGLQEISIFQGVLVPFENFVYLSESSEVIIGQNWMLCAFSIEDLALIEGMGGFRGRRYGSQVCLPSSEQHGASWGRFIAFEDSDFYGDGWAAKLREGNEFPDVQVFVDRFVASLKLAKDGALAAKRPICMLEGPLGYIRWSYDNYSLFNVSRHSTEVDIYRLEDGDVGEVRHIWQSLGKSGVQKKLDLAISRFISACLRPTLEDELVDLVIAAESLFGGAAKSEITHRVSLNFAIFVDSPELSRPEVRRFIRDVYRLRSSIVHGGRQRSIRVLGGRLQSLKGVVELMSRLMRLALNKAVTTLADGRDDLDWERQLDSVLEQWMPMGR